jgi:hypothetical protein
MIPSYQEPAGRESLPSLLQFGNLMLRTLSFLSLSIALAAAIPLPARAADPAPPATQPAALDPAIVPFVTAGTLIVAKADLSAVDLVAVRDSMVNAARTAMDTQKAAEIVAWLDQTLPQAQRWLVDFHHAGGRIIYGVAFLGDPAALPGVLIVPLTTQSDAHAIASLLVSGSSTGPDHREYAGPLDDNNHRAGVEAEIINNAVVFGAMPQVEKMKLARPVDRPMLAEAMASLSGSPFQIAVSPSIALQLIAGDALPEKLPDVAGGGSPADLVHTLAWAAWGGTPPPLASMRFLVQCQDDLGVQQFAAVYESLLATMANDPAARKLIPDMDQLLAALKPTQSGNLLSINLEARTFNSLILPRLLLAYRAVALDLWPPVPATQP